MTDPMTVLHDQIGILGVALARRASGTTPRRARGPPGRDTAAAAIDAMLARLYAARSALLTQIPQSDDATAARGDALRARRAARRRPRTCRGRG